MRRKGNSGIRVGIRVRVFEGILVRLLDLGEALEVRDGGAVGSLYGYRVKGCVGGLEVEIGGLEGGDDGEEGRY